jgi:S-adenosylmethionine-dependent methyltransferase
VVPYIDDVPAFLKMLAGCLLPGGLLSLVSLNRYSQVYRAALPQGNLAEALAQLNAPTGHSITFDTTLRYFDAETMCGLLEEAGYTVEAHYGIHCLCAYWGTNDLKFDPAIMSELERLEFALADQHPYRLLARYFHLIARKQ